MDQQHPPVREMYVAVTHPGGRVTYSSHLVWDAARFTARLTADYAEEGATIALVSKAEYLGARSTPN